ncbi:MAG: hypothetical protein ACFCD0_09155 [Gemmataceae bacterium]
MYITRLWESPLFLALITFCLLCLCGCFHQAVQMPDPHHVHLIRSTNPVARHHVYIVMLDGLDPIGTSHLAGLRNYLNRLGYRKTIYGSIYRTHWVAREMRRHAKLCPEARFVVVGCGMGAKTLPHIVNKALAEDVAIDLVVHFDHTQSDGFVEVTDTSNMTTILRLGSLKNKETTHRLMAELTNVASLIPVAYPPTQPRKQSTEQLPLPKVAPGPERLPHPRIYSERQRQMDAEWNKALDPVSVLPGDVPQARSTDPLISEHSSGWRP